MSITIRDKIGSRIRQLREQSGLTQGQLAERAGVSLRTVINIELGSFDPKLGTVDKITSALNSHIAILEK